MSEDNRTLAVKWMDDNWNRRREAVIEELLDPHSIGYMEGTQVRGPTEFRAVRSELLAAFPDLRVEIQDVVADGALVALRWRMRATHTGSALGLAPSGKSVDVVGSTWFRFAGGRIIEGYDTWNQGALLASLAA
jgi:steroid delta-isomerase-like uncharacterized protein